MDPALARQRCLVPPGTRLPTMCPGAGPRHAVGLWSKNPIGLPNDGLSSGRLPDRERLVLLEVDNVERFSPSAHKDIRPHAATKTLETTRLAPNRFDTA